MNLQNPEALYFILPAMFALLALALYARAMRRRAAEAFADEQMRARIMPRESSTRFWLKLGLLEAGTVLALLALARPQWGEMPEEVKVKGSDLYVLIDVSRSMLAKDVAPSRLERAKLDVSSLLNRLKGERVGLIAFAGRAAVKCPLTADYAFFRIALNELGPHSVERGGTAIGDAIRVALNVLPSAADRDQALLLITDGDDQDSDPMHAAAAAAERHVTIFTVGLGDPTEGARVPDKEGLNLKFEGKDVISKMDDELLRKIALETNGAYVPARTSAYDLGKLYEEKLALLRGEYTKQQKRARMTERFEIPLLLAVLCFLVERFLSFYEPRVEENSGEAQGSRKMGQQNRNSVKAAGAAFVAVMALCSSAFGADSGGLAREGLQLYEKKDYAAAGEKFSDAEKAFEKDREDAARSAFNAGCAFQRDGKFDKAREMYLKAVLAPSKELGANAQFNLGTLASDEAKKLAGDTPENVAPDKRPELVEKLKTAVGHFRNAMELQPDYPGARANIELVRQWIKLYSNKWYELDRKKHRDSLNLLQYLDELAKTQRGLRKAAKLIDENASSDEFAELKRAQDELREEIEPLKEKIKTEIGGGQQQQTNAGNTPMTVLKPNAMDPKQMELAIQKLTEWADEAGAKMRAASDKFSGWAMAEALAAQKEAVAPLERSWEALAPFGATLQRDYDEQSGISGLLNPEEKEAEKAPEKKDDVKIKDDTKAKEPEKKSEVVKKEPPTLTKEDFEELAEFQSDVMRRTDMLKGKAERELSELEKQAAANPNAAPKDPKKEEEKKWLTIEDMKREEEEKKRAQNPPPAGTKDEKREEGDGPPDPEAIKKGLQKAIELAPKAADKMKSAVAHFEKQERDAAAPDAAEAKRILKEILDAQPKQKNKDQKKDDKQNQQNKDQDKDKQNQKNKDDKDKKDQDQKKKDEKDKQDKDKDKGDKKDQDKKEEGKQDQQKQAVKLSKEQAEEMLRKVQEREAQRRKQKADDKEAIYGRMHGVEKDW